MPRHNTRGSSVFEKVSGSAQSNRESVSRKMQEKNQSTGNYVGAPTNIVQRTTRERAAEAGRAFKDKFNSNQQTSGRG